MSWLFFLNIHFSAVLIIIICTKRPRHWLLRGRRRSQKSFCSSPVTWLVVSENYKVRLCSFSVLFIYFFFAACMPRRWLGWNVCVVCCWPHRLNWRGRGLWCRPWIFLLTIRMYKGLTVPTLLSNKCFHTLLVFSFSSNLFQSVSFWLSPKKSTGIKMFV